MKLVRALLSLLALAAHFGFAVNARAEDSVIADFESPDLGDWKLMGIAFNSGAATGDLLARLEIENAHGQGVASSEIEGDGPIGILISPESGLRY